MDFILPCGAKKFIFWPLRKKNPVWHAENIYFTLVVVILALLGHQTSHSRNNFFFPLVVQYTIISFYATYPLYHTRIFTRKSAAMKKIMAKMALDRIKQMNSFYLHLKIFVSKLCLENPNLRSCFLVPFHIGRRHKANSK